MGEGRLGWGNEQSERYKIGPPFGLDQSCKNRFGESETKGWIKVFGEENKIVLKGSNVLHDRKNCGWTTKGA